MAVDEFNKANAGCQITVKQFDTEGDPQKATQAAPQIVGDASVIALLGPAFSGETKATGAIFNQAGLISVTASATNPGLTTNGWTNFFRGLGNDNSQGGAVANYMTGQLGYKKVCVAQDDSDYGVGLAEVVIQTLGAAADGNCSIKVKTGDKDFSAGVQIIKGESPDAIYYAGYFPEAAPFKQQLTDAGVTATFVSGDGTNSPDFVTQAGASSKGALLTCPCGPAPAEFATAYQAFAGIAPGCLLGGRLRPGNDHGDRDRLRQGDRSRQHDRVLQDVRAVRVLRRNTSGTPPVSSPPRTHGSTRFSNQLIG